MQKNTLIKMKLQDVNIVVEDKPWTSVIFINAKGKALQIKCTGVLIIRFSLNFQNFQNPKLTAQKSKYCIQ